MSQSVPERIKGQFVNQIADTRYVAVTITFDWTTNTICSTNFNDFGVLEFDYNFIRALNNNFMLIDVRCYYFDQSNIQQNVLILDKNGKEVKSLCFGDGIQDCITKSDGSIIVSYSDEGVFGNYACYGWKNPLGSSGLIVWDENGNKI